MTINLPEREAKRVQIAVDRNPVETSFQRWAKPGHFSRSLAKGPNTTTWIWNLHADAHDFDSHTSDLQDISRKVFSAHFGQLGVIFIWLSGMYFHGARFSNYEAWLSDPTHIKPSAQIVWPIVGQEILNGDVGGGFQGVQITSGFFQLWRASGITSELQLYSTAMGGLIMAAAMFFAGWFHYHKAAPRLEWFQNVESMLNHHLGGLLGLGSLGWAGHQIHVSLPINKLLDAGVDPKEIPLPHEFLLNRALMADLYPSFAKGLTPFFTLDWSSYADFLTFKGGLNPVTGGLWLTDTAHHHLAIAVLFLVAGHMYRTNWGIGHSMKQILDEIRHFRVYTLSKISLTRRTFVSFSLKRKKVWKQKQDLRSKSRQKKRISLRATSENTNNSLPNSKSSSKKPEYRLQKRLEKAIPFYGVKYSSFHAAAKANGIAVETAPFCLNNEKNLDWCYENKNKRVASNTARPVVVDGVFYPSVSFASAQHEISEKATRKNIKSKENWSFF